MKTLLALILMALPSLTLAGQCRAQSGEQTSALVELYTSEGCNSCPPADRWLSALGDKYRQELVVPLALHVDYWDYIGWKDPYAKREFSQRQRRLSQMQRAAFVYTPQVLVQGAEVRDWADSRFNQTITRINAQPARARLELEIMRATTEALDVRVNAAILDAAQGPDARLYVATYENRLE